MTTLVLNAETAQIPLGSFLAQAGNEGVRVRDAEGNVVAIVLSPADHEAWTYAEAFRDIAENREEVMAALARRGGITTAELLRRCEALAPSGQ